MSVNILSLSLSLSPSLNSSRLQIGRRDDEVEEGALPALRGHVDVVHSQ